MAGLPKFNFKNIVSAIKGAQSDYVYFPGCTTQKYLPSIAENYKTILTDLGISIRTVEPFCCGQPLKEQGYLDDFEKHKAKTKEFLKKNNATKIVTNCSTCLLALKEEYGVDVIHTTELIAQHKQKLQTLNKGEVSIQDNCTTARKLNIVNQQRDILVQTGYRLKEFPECKRDVRCCGGACGLPNNASGAAIKLGQRRLKDAPSNIIVTDDPHCYLQLKKNTQTKDVLELSETLVEI